MNAVTKCDEIEFYGIGLKLVGMSEFKTGQMFVRGGTEIRALDNAAAPEGVGKIALKEEAGKITAIFDGSSLSVDEQVYSIMLADAIGDPLTFYYTFNTLVEVG